MAKGENTYTTGEKLVTPSYKKVLKSIKNQDKVAADEQQKQLEWATQFYTDAQAMNLDVIGDLDQIRAFQLGNATEDRDRLEKVYYELENEQMAEINQFQQRATDFDAEVETLKADAIQYKSEANQQYMAGKEVAKVGQTFAAERQASERALMDMGVNPSSGASASLSAGLRLAEGAAQAAAGTVAADEARKTGDEMYQAALDRQIQAGALAETGLNLQKGMVDVGRTYPEQIIASGEQARAAGAQGIDQTVAIADATNKANEVAQNWAQIGIENTQTWTDTLDTNFQNQLGVEELRLKEEEIENEAEANESSGIGSALGAAAGVVTSFLPGFQAGGAVNDPNISQSGGSSGNWSPTGTMSAATQQRPSVGPSMLASTDTVPAKLTPGEFVIPKHVVDWKGQEYFQKLLKQAPLQQKSMLARTETKPGALTI